MDRQEGMFVTKNPTKLASSLTDSHPLTPPSESALLRVQKNAFLFQMIKTEIMTPFEAPGNLLKIESNQRSMA